MNPIAGCMLALAIGFTADAACSVRADRAAAAHLFGCGVVCLVGTALIVGLGMAAP